MANEHAIIKPLSLETQAQIRASVQLSSLHDVVLGLVKNCLDADAGNIKIKVDFLKGYCSVLDDGNGIPTREFLEGGSLAQLYCTSKEIDSINAYGRYGRFLASLSGVSLVSLTSKHAFDDSTNTLLIKDGVRVATTMNTNDQDLGDFRHGTRVIAYNLFGQMPVRVKHRLARFKNVLEQERELAHLKRSLARLILAAPKRFCLELRDTLHQYIHKPNTGPKTDNINTIFDLNHVVTTMYQAGLIETGNLDNWRIASAKSHSLFLQAAIHLKPAPSKLVQFVSLGQHPLTSELSQPLVEQVNSLFDASSFASVDNFDEHDLSKEKPGNHPYARRQVSGRKRTVDRWPMFYMRIDFNGSYCHPDNLAEAQENKIISSIGGVLHGLVVEFLQLNGFTSRLSEPSRIRSMQKTATTEAGSGDVLGFSAWSRIKAGKGGTADLLTGLPFMHQEHCDTVQLPPVQSTSVVSTTCNTASPDVAIEWTNPRNGNIVQLHPRTGMVLPSRERAPTTKQNISRRLRTVRTLTDIVKTEKEYGPPVRVQQAISSIVAENATSTENIPVFCHGEHVHNLGSGTPLRLSGPEFTELQSLNVTKVNLKTASVLGQVDKKFILVSIILDKGNTALLLIDQHAADERIKVEDLFQRLCSNHSVALPTPIVFEVNKQEVQRLQRLQTYFTGWNVRYTITNSKVCVSALPDLIIERCRLEPRLLIDLLRHEAWRERPTPPLGTRGDHWPSVIGACPEGLVDMLASRACRSAFMFNDELSLEQCEDIIARLAECSFPFQCAHGRPSLTSLAQFRGVGDSDSMGSTFGESWKAWVG